MKSLMIWRALKHIAVLSIGLFVFVSIALAGSDTILDNKPVKVEGATIIANADCAACHDASRFANLPVFHNDCAACHGGGSVHTQDPEVKGSIAFPDDKKCLACHESGFKNLMHWKSSNHRQAGLVCADCHNPHGQKDKIVREKEDFRLPDIDGKSALCIGCHQDVMAKFALPSHHPLREGGITCLDCHDPHADSNLNLLEKNETCFRCHQNKQGPWIYEHPPVVEDCTICHEPHGAVNPSLQNIPQPTQCLRCHTLSDTRHEHNDSGTGIVGAAVLRKCTACHGMPHGSHEDAYYRR